VRIWTIKIGFDPAADSIRIRSTKIGFDPNSVLESVRTLPANVTCSSGATSELPTHGWSTSSPSNNQVHKHNSNNNNPTYGVPECRKTSVALTNVPAINFSQKQIPPPFHQPFSRWTRVSQYPSIWFLHSLRKRLIDWVVALRPTRHKIGHFRDVPQANLLAWYGKTKPNTTKAHIHQSQEMYYHTKI